MHSTPVDVFLYIRSSSGRVVVGDQEIGASGGDIVLSPKGIPHGLKADRSGEFSVLVVKAPSPDAQRLRRGD
ncbi:MAG: AraC family ligand binding domain-containing protein [Firmicutes bacterium]|nr:AraC family ligand binding domain-containing protein [Bacillota bacterium]MDH7495700.1 AraC family ligand binding domain-containing protein [Bacillota bacterium]